MDGEAEAVGQDFAKKEIMYFFSGANAKPGNVLEEYNVGGILHGSGECWR